MQDLASQMRIHQILQEKANMGMGYGGDYGMGGVLLGTGGYRKRRPNSHAMKVKAYMRKHRGVTLGEASQAVAGSRGAPRGYRRKAPKRRRTKRNYGYGEGVLVGGEPLWMPTGIAKAQEKQALKTLYENAMCQEERNKHLSGPALKNWYKMCAEQGKYNPKTRKATLRKVLNELMNNPIGNLV